ncbi:heat shock 70 kDa protein 12B-like [Mya arenaria]|uniref:heat shock 70 kDa protein 12B-like n=1 Tax=Mya arenaria TaxID=6604 RepID=UPI0022E3301F|nr:heat shock 70 kDa protein 12B-like [Mya arenaria]
MKGFFDTAVDGIVKFIQQIRTTDELGMIHTILMFGGFSESKYVQERIENEIPGVRLVIPTDPSLAVLKGAVLYGKTPRAITERIARFSYGFSVGRPFEEGIDPEELKYTKNGKKYCGSIFEKLITKGQILKQGQIFSDKINYFLDTDTDLSSMLSKAPAAAPIFKSTKVDPSKYSTAEDCEEIGKLIILPPPTGWPLVSVFDHDHFMTQDTIIKEQQVIISEIFPLLRCLLQTQLECHPLLFVESGILPNVGPNLENDSILDWNPEYN